LRPCVLTRALALSISLTASLAGCGGGGQTDTNRVRGDTLTVYSSGPSHGVSADAAEAVFVGQRRALRQAGGRAGGRRIRLVRLAATRPGDALWDPGTVKANAERARDDPSAIAYLGELDYGGSAVSLPVTNRAGLLQVSPTDGLTSLTRAPPGRPRAGPERYYPEDQRTFARLVPTDLVVAEQMVSLLRARQVDRVAILHREGIADRELTAVLAQRLRRAGIEPAFAESLRDDVEAVPELIRKLAASRAEAVVYLGARGPATAAALAGVAARLPGVPVLGSAGLAGSAPAGPAPRELRAITPVLPSRQQPESGRRVLAALRREHRVTVRPEALYGFASMRLVLQAIDRAGPDRRSVVRAALARGVRQTVVGRLSVDGSGDVLTRRLALFRVRDGRVAFERLLP